MQAIDGLIQIYVLRDRQKEALPLARELLEGRLAELGQDDSETLSAMNTLAVILSETGETEEAERLYEQVLEAQERVLGPDHPHVQGLRVNLALLDYQKGMELRESNPAEYQRRLARARKLGEKALDVRTRTLGEEHPDTLASMNNLGAVYRALGLFEEGDKLAKKDLEISVRTLGEDHPDSIVALANMGGSLRNRRLCDEAIQYLERALRGARKSHPPDAPGTAFILGWYGSCLRELGRYAEAEPMLIEAREIIERTLGPNHPIANQMALDLAIQYEAWDRAEPGRGYSEEGARWRETYQTTSAPAATSSPAE